MIIAPANRIEHISEYYFSKKLAEIKQLQDAGHPIINLGIGSPDMPPSPTTLSALCESAQKTDSHGYQSYRGLAELREAIADFYAQTYKVSLQPQRELLPLMGSKEGIMHISMSFLNEGDKVLIPNPGYPTYSSVTKLMGAIPLYYDLIEEHNWEIDIEQLKKMDLSKVKLLWLNTPHMPTGIAYNKNILQQLIQLAREQHFLIVCDNPYSMVLTEKPKSILQLCNTKDVVLELNSLSKSHNMAGWRVGWIAGKQDYIDTILKVKSNMDSGMFLPVQKASVQALKNAKTWHKQRNEVYARRKIKAYELLDLLDCTYHKHQEGMFVWAKAPDKHKNIEAWIDELLYKAGVFLTPGFIFGSNGQRYIRISLCSNENNIDKAIQQLKKVV